MSEEMLLISRGKSDFTLTNVMLGRSGVFGMYQNRHGPLFKNISVKVFYVVI